MFYFKRPTLTFGFTLVELIVVIAIIGILTSIVLANLAGARAGARDDIRKTDLKNLQAAIELYKAQNGYYPLRGCIDALDPVGYWSGANPESHPSVEQCTNYIEGLVPDYIPALPIDLNPTLNNSGYIYRTDANVNPKAYKIMAWNSLEVKRVSDYDDEFARCPRAIPNVCPTPFPPLTPFNAGIHATYAVYGGSSSEGW